MIYEATTKDGIKELGIFEKKNDAWVSSKKLAELFDKRHSDVLRDIESLKTNLDIEFTERNFALSSYKDRSRKKNKMYMLNRKSFALIAMGFTGKKAIDFKVKYIEAFESMTSHIETRLISKNGYKEMTKAISKNIGNDARTFSQEANMINKIVLGMSASEFKEINNLGENELTRDSVITELLVKLDKAQRLNAQLITATVDRESRTTAIERNFKYMAV